MKILAPPSSGSINGVTHSRNRFGQYTRKRATPVNPQTPKQAARRDAFSGNSSGWRGLTVPQRILWNSYAAQLPVTDSLGQVNFLTGAQQFVGVNSLRALFDQPPLTSPPPLPAFTGATPTAAIAGTVVSVSFGQSLGAGQLFEIFGTPKVSGGRQFSSVKNQLRLVEPLTAVVTVAGVPVVVTAAYNEVFGAINTGDVLAAVWLATREVSNWQRGPLSPVRALIVI